jgi:urease accessory protein
VPERLLGFELLATVVLLGPAAAEGARAMHTAPAAAPADGRAAVLTAASPLAGGAILRLAARSVEEGMELIRTHLAFIDAPLDGNPLLRRP